MRYSDLKEKELDLLSKIKQDIAGLPPDVNPRLLGKIERLIQLALQGKDEKGRDPSEYGDVASPLSKIDDNDVKAHYKTMAKFMLGNGLTFDEIKDIINLMKEDKLINQNELRAVSSDISKIIPYYKTSQGTQHYFDDMLMYQPGQRIGPGEILFATHSKDLTKGTKGDVTVISQGREIEVKGGRTGGRFSDDDVKTNSNQYLKNATEFIKKYQDIVGKPGKSGYSMAHLVGAIRHNSKQADDLARDAAITIGSLWGDSQYIKNIEQELKAGNAEQALYYHGLANLEVYFGAKAAGMAILFIDASKQPAATNYADSLPELLEVCTVIVKSAYPITTRVGEAFPKITAIVK